MVISPAQKTFTLLVALLLEISFIQASVDNEDERGATNHDNYNSYNGYKHERPFLVRDIQIGDNIKLPISPITVIIFVTSAIILYRTFTKNSSAVASHILLDGGKTPSDDEKVKQKMVQIKAEINNDPAKFASFAKKYSQCPSGKTGSPPGSLGRFQLGTMTPSFDKAVFSRSSNVGEVIGPVQTQFGYHLILIHERDEQRQLVMD